MPSSAHPFPRHQASTRFLRVPTVDWAAVKGGFKTEFRTTPREGSRLLTCYTPTPVVAYVTQRGPFRELDSKLMILEERRYEPLFNIVDDQEGLAREGFEDYAVFRRYWRARHGGKYVPLQRVWVWRVRDFKTWDLEAEGARLIEQLYAEHLP